MQGDAVTARVRFVGVAIENPRPGTSAALVELEWRGTRFVGFGEGEISPPAEMRTCAKAALEALHQVIPDGPTFTLVGAKAVRIFDTDLVAVLLQAEGLTHNLIGAALVRGSAHEAAVLAVLDATNRLVGKRLGQAE